MKPKNTLILDDEFIQYCKLNNINDVVKFAKQVFEKGFTIVKYGELPKSIHLNKELTTKPVLTSESVLTSEPKSVEPIIIKKEVKDLYDE